MPVALSRARRKAREVIERLMMRLEVNRAIPVVDHRALDVRGLHAVTQRRMPAAGIPGPRYPPGQERVANGLEGLWRCGMLGGICQACIATHYRGNAARLIRWLRESDRIAIWCHRAIEEGRWP